MDNVQKVCNFKNTFHSPQSSLTCRWSQSPEIGTSFNDWAEQSTFYLMTKTDSSLRNVMFLIKVLIKLRRYTISRKFVILTTHHRHKPSEKIYFAGKIQSFLAKLIPASLLGVSAAYC
jgi:hypothetical protein